MAGACEPDVRASQSGGLHSDAGAERVGCKRKTPRLGSHCRSVKDHRTNTRHRRAARHDGSRAHGVDVAAGEERALPALPERQSHVDVRRSENLRRRRHPVSQRRRRRTVLTTPQAESADLSKFGYDAELRRSLSLGDLLVYGLVFIVPIAPFAIFGIVFNASKGMVALTYLIGLIA